MLYGIDEYVMNIEYPIHQYRYFHQLSPYHRYFHLFISYHLSVSLGNDAGGKPSMGRLVFSGGKLKLYCLTTVGMP